MPKAWRSSYNLAFKLKVVAEAIDNNSAITRGNGSLLAKRSSEPLKVAEHSFQEPMPNSP